MGSLKKVAVVLLVAALCVSVNLNVLFYSRMLEYERSLQTLLSKVNELTVENANLKKNLEVIQRRLEYYPTNASPAGEWISIAGVTITKTGSYKGELMRIYARFIEGSGKVLIATTPKIGINLQASAETAFAVAQRVANLSIENMDCVLTVVANKTIDVVDGPSAGGAITVLLTSMLLGIDIRRDVVMTGTIQRDGTIGEVGGIIEKATAAAEAGAKTFLVPKGQSTTLIYVEKVTQIGFVRIIEYVPKLVNVQEYLREHGYNITVVEVSNIHEALSYFKASL